MYRFLQTSGAGSSLKELHLKEPATADPLVTLLSARLVVDRSNRRRWDPSQLFAALRWRMDHDHNGPPAEPGSGLGNMDALNNICPQLVCFEFRTIFMSVDNSRQRFELLEQLVRSRRKDYPNDVRYSDVDPPCFLEHLIVNRAGKARDASLPDWLVDMRSAASSSTGAFSASWDD